MVTAAGDAFPKAPDGLRLKFDPVSPRSVRGAYAAMTPTAPSPPVRLITRGDDAASCRSANRAILHAFEHGVLRNVSVMAPAPELDHAATVLAQAEGLCIGLHATLTSEWDHPRWGPLLGPDAVPSLVDESGCFPRDLDALRRLDPSMDEARRELSTQLERLRRVGFDVAYVDEHMGVGWVNGVRDVLAELADDHGLVYLPHLDGQQVQLPFGPSCLDYVAGVASALRDLPSGDFLLLGHPVFDDEDARGLHRLGYPGERFASERSRQREVFCDDAVKNAIRERGIEVVTYTGLAATRGGTETVRGES